MGIEGVLNKPGQRLIELEGAWELRLREAECLAKNGFGTGAMLAYMYALEIRLKVAICDHLGLDNLPKAFEIHDFDGLLILTGLRRQIHSDEDLRPRWSRLLLVCKNYEHARYRPQAGSDLEDAKEVGRILNDPTIGVISWLSKHRPHETPC